MADAGPGVDVDVDGLAASDDDAQASSDAEGGATLDPSLLGWWSFDDLTGASVADLSGRGNVAILSGDAVITQTGTHAKGAVSLSKEGKVDIPSLSGASFPRTGTLSLWFKWRTMDLPDHVGVFDLWTSDRSHVFLRHANGDVAGHFQVAFQDSSPGYPFVWGFDVPAETWAHVVITWDEAALRGAIYVNGAVVAERGYDRDFAPTGQVVQLGVDFDGAIDELRLYGRVLGADEIAALP